MNRRVNFVAVLSALNEAVDALEELFAVDGVGENKLEILRDLLDDVLPKDYVEQNWERLQRIVGQIVLIRKAASFVGAAVRKARKA